MHTPQQQQPQQWQQTARPLPKRRMGALQWSLIAAGVVVVLVVGLVLVSTVAAKVAGSLPSASATPTASSGVGLRTPSEDQERVYLAALKAIDPGLTVNTERAVRRAERVCDRILHGSDGGSMSLERYTVAELSGGNATIDEQQAKRVIRAVKVWCR
jgi:hypothetical protein